MDESREGISANETEQLKDMCACIGEQRVVTDSNYDTFYEIFDTASSGMVLIDQDSRISLINKAWKDIMQIDEMFMIGKRFGDGFRCINSLLDGCGNSKKCIICKINNNVTRVLDSRQPSYDITLTNEFIINQKHLAPKLKASFIPITMKGNNSVLITVDDITEMIQ